MAHTLKSRRRSARHPVIFPQPDIMHDMLQLTLTLQRMPARESLQAPRLILGLMKLLHARVGLWCRFQLGEGTAPSCRVPIVIADLPQRVPHAQRLIRPLDPRHRSTQQIISSLQEGARSITLTLDPVPAHLPLEIGPTLCSVRRHPSHPFSLLQFHRPLTAPPFTPEDSSILRLTHSITTGWPRDEG